MGKLHFVADLKRDDVFPVRIPPHPLPEVRVGWRPSVFLDMKVFERLRAQGSWRFPIEEFPCPLCSLWLRASSLRTHGTRFSAVMDFG